jgi:hypothetical protein
MSIKLNRVYRSVRETAGFFVACEDGKSPYSEARSWLRQLGCVAVKFGVLSLALLALVSPLVLPAQEKTLPFQPGETLNYDVTWSVFPAGIVSATLRSEGQESKDDYAVTTTARSQGFVSVLYNVQNEFRSLFNPRTMCSEKISKKIAEGRRHKETEIVFDSRRKLAILDERDLNKPNEPAKHAENETPGCVEDVVTAFYYLRRQNLQVGKAIHLPVNDGWKTFEVTVDVQARERIQTPLGERDAIRVEPKVFSGLFKRKGRMLIWFSDDPQRLPLRIKFIIAVGTITGNLRSVSQDTEKPSPEKG